MKRLQCNFPRRLQRMWREQSVFGICVIVFISSLVNGWPTDGGAADGLSVGANWEQRSEKLLIDALGDHGQWSSVHAAEYLLLAGIREPVLAAFRPQRDVGTCEYRIGVWRVLAKAETRLEEQQCAIDRIRDVLLAGAPDQLHAIESLAKLRAPIRDEAERTIVMNVATKIAAPGRSFAIWRLLQEAPRSQWREVLFEELRSDDSVLRLRAAFVLSQLRDLSEWEFGRLRGQLKQEEPKSIVVPYLATAIGEPEFREVMLATDLEWRAIAISEMARRQMEIDIDLSPLLTQPESHSLRLAAAFALLSQRQSK